MEEQEIRIDIPAIHWFPGHMAKTRRMIVDSLKLVDLVLELADARIPRSSRNPELDGWINGKPRILMLNKSDQADPEMTQRWLAYFRSEGIPALACDCRSGAGVNRFQPLVRQTLADQLARRKEKGMEGRIRIMVVGVPNVGKSSFINRMAGGRRAKAEDRPGVTRGKQWVRLEKDMDGMAAGNGPRCLQGRRHLGQTRQVGVAQDEAQIRVRDQPPGRRGHEGVAVLADIDRADHVPDQLQIDFRDGHAGVASGMGHRDGHVRLGAAPVIDRASAEIAVFSPPGPGRVAPPPLGPGRPADLALDRGQEGVDAFGGGARLGALRLDRGPLGVLIVQRQVDGAVDEQHQADEAHEGHRELPRERQAEPARRRCRGRRGGERARRRHSTISSAWARSADEMVTPMVRAVFRFTMKSNFVGAWTGRVAGFSPRRIRPT